MLEINYWKIKGESARVFDHTDFKSGEGVPVTVTVTDQAGNKTEKTQKLFIDSLAPTVSLTGAADYMITSQPVTIEYQVADENKLESCQAVIDYEKPDGEKKIGGHRFGRKVEFKE